MSKKKPKDKRLKEAIKHPAWDDFRECYYPVWKDLGTDNPIQLELPVIDEWFPKWDIFKAGWDCADEHISGSYSGW